ncbi:MAG: S-layer homology domain-containing protein [Chloroflexota bacterium]
MPADSFAAAYIEQLHADGVTDGCGGGNYCPAAFITRAEMAVFLVAAFNLP